MLMNSKNAKKNTVTFTKKCFYSTSSTIFNVLEKKEYVAWCS